MTREIKRVPLSASVNIGTNPMLEAFYKTANEDGTFPDNAFTRAVGVALGMDGKTPFTYTFEDEEGIFFVSGNSPDIMDKVCEVFPFPFTETYFAMGGSLCWLPWPKR